MDYRIKYKKHYEIEFGTDYVIHHIDEDRNNNDISNLLLLPRDLHSKYHEYKREFLDQSDGEVDLYTLERLLSVLKDIDFWIEQKYNADIGYKDAYFMFKGAAI